jgi:RHS repeat-associated protein
LLRRISAVTATLFAWYVFAPSVGAVLAPTPVSPGRTRKLASKEMERIVGAQKSTLFGGGGGTIEPDETCALLEAPGTTYPWEGNVGGTNTGNGNKLTSLSLVGWKVRGGRLAIDFALIHNSQGGHNAELGPRWTHSYNLAIVEEYDPLSSDYLPRVHWGNDLAYSFGKDINNDLVPPTGIHDTLVKTGTGTSATYDLTTKDQITYHYTTSDGTNFYCTTIKDRNDNTITLTYSSGKVSSISDGTGRSITLGYTSGMLTSVTDPMSNVWTLGYTSGKLTSVTYPALTGDMNSYSVQYGYNANNRITSITDRRGKVWAYTYDVSGSLLTETNPLNKTTTYTYTSSYTEVTDPNGNAIRHNYSSGKLASVRDASSDLEYYTYDGDNNRTEVTDRRGKLWEYTYDGMGNVLTSTDPLSHTTTYTYTAKNDVDTVTSELSHVTDYDYDGDGNLTSVTDPLNHTTTYTVNSYGQVTEVEDALTHSTTFDYDSYGNREEVTDALSHVTTYDFDLLGRVIEVTDATSKSTTTDYDEWGRVISVTTPGNRTTTFTYNANGQKVGQTNPLSDSQSWTYDDAGQLTSHTDELSRTVSYGYDNGGRKTSFTDGRNKVTYYTYNVRNELTEIDYPDSTSDTWTYNDNGDIATKTTALGTITYEYDDAGRLIEKDYSTALTDVTFSYDDDNRTTQMVDGTGTTTYTYDNAGRLTGRSAPSPASAVTFSYDNANRLTARTVAGTGVTSYTYDNADQLIEVTMPMNGGALDTTYTYDNAGRLLTSTLPNGNVETRTYDATSKDLTSVVVTTSGSTVLSSQTYTYDGMGRRDTETLPGSIVIDSDYDDAGQLVDETRTGGGAYSIQYTYDNAGNRLTKVLNSVTESYTYDDANKLTAAGNKTYTYNGAGGIATVSVSGSTVSTLTWDVEGRVASVASGGTTKYNTYNGIGQRVAKATGGTPTASYTLEDDSIDSNVLKDGSATYHQGPNGLIAETRSSTDKYYHADALGTTRAITNSGGSVTDTLTTDAFGLTVSSSGSTPTPFGFAGQHGYQTDSETGLMRLGHRYYDSSTGRFISRDPIHDGYNWFTYCDNDPVNVIDPEGLKPPYGTPDAAGKAAIININAKSFKEGKEYAGWIIKLPDGNYDYTKPVPGGKSDSNAGPQPPNAVGHYHTHGYDDPGYINEDFGVQDKRKLYYGMIPGYLGTPGGLIKKWVPAVMTDPSAPVQAGTGTTIGKMPMPPKKTPKPPKTKP